MNDPDGLVAIWNLHLLDRPEFLFHSQVRCAPSGCHSPCRPRIDTNLTSSAIAVGRPVPVVLPLPPKPHLRRHIRRSDPSVGHPGKTTSGRQNPTSRWWTHISSILDEGGRNAERSPYHDKWDGWNRVQLATRGHGTAAGEDVSSMISLGDG